MERKEIGKTIATCTPSEFMAQCYKIAGKAKLKKQGRDNLWAIFDELFGKYPKETTELFGLMCFIEPSEIDNYNGMELTAKCIDMLGDENVATFLVSLSKILR